MAVIAIPKIAGAIALEGKSGETYYAVQSIGTLSRELVDYFPNRDVDKWFHWSETRKKKFIRECFWKRCVVTGELRPEVHEIYPQGMGERKYTLAPWNMICVTARIHRLLHSYSWTVERCDRLDNGAEREGIVILGIDGRRISLWWTLPLYERNKRLSYR